MDLSTDTLIIATLVFVLVTLPLLAVAVRLRQMTRILLRIENMNLRSLQRWS